MPPTLPRTDSTASATLASGNGTHARAECTALRRAGPVVGSTVTTGPVFPAREGVRPSACHVGYPKPLATSSRQAERESPEASRPRATWMRLATSATKRGSAWLFVMESGVPVVRVGCGPLVSAGQGVTWTVQGGARLWALPL